MSRKTAISCTIDSDSLDRVSVLSETFGVSKSMVMSLLLNVALTYFTEDQLRMELYMMGELDGRRARRGI